MARIKKGDTVIVRTGASKGVTGSVVRVNASSNTVVVEGANLKKNFVKKTDAKGAGGSIVERPAPIHISNVALLDPKTKKATRVGYRVEGDKKVRVAKKSGSVISK